MWCLKRYAKMMLSCPSLRRRLSGKSKKLIEGVCVEEERVEKPVTGWQRGSVLAVKLEEWRRK